MLTELVFLLEFLQMTFSVAIFCLESDEENESGAAGQQQRRRTPQKRQRRSNANRSNNYDANAAAAAAQQPQQPKERPDAKHHLKVLLPPQATILSLGLNHISRILPIFAKTQAYL